MRSVNFGIKYRVNPALTKYYELERQLNPNGIIVTVPDHLYRVDEDLKNVIYTFFDEDLGIANSVIHALEMVAEANRSLPRKTPSVIEMISTVTLNKSINEMMIMNTKTFDVFVKEGNKLKINSLGDIPKEAFIGYLLPNVDMQTLGRLERSSMLLRGYVRRSDAWRIVFYRDFPGIAEQMQYTEKMPAYLETFLFSKATSLEPNIWKAFYEYHHKLIRSEKQLKYETIRRLPDWVVGVEWYGNILLMYDAVGRFRIDSLSNNESFEFDLHVYCEISMNSIYVVALVSQDVTVFKISGIKIMEKKTTNIKQYIGNNTSEHIALLSNNMLLIDVDETLLFHVEQDLSCSFVERHEYSFFQTSKYANTARLLSLEDTEHIVHVEKTGFKEIIQLDNTQVYIEKLLLSDHYFLIEEEDKSVIQTYDLQYKIEISITGVAEFQEYGSILILRKYNYKRYTYNTKTRTTRELKMKDDENKSSLGWITPQGIIKYNNREISILSVDDLELVSFCINCYENPAEYEFVDICEYVFCSHQCAEKTWNKTVF